jgi:hypothetical protein
VHDNYGAVCDDDCANSDNTSDDYSAVCDDDCANSDNTSDDAGSVESEFGS